MTSYFPLISRICRRREVQELAPLSSIFGGREDERRYAPRVVNMQKTIRYDAYEVVAPRRDAYSPPVNTFLSRTAFEGPLGLAIVPVEPHATAEHFSLAIVCCFSRIELCFDINVIILEPSITFTTPCAHAYSTLEHLLKPSLYHTQSQPKAKYQPLRLCLIGTGK